jgi:N-acetylneuraminate synthase/N,N'-diacetyllegionaminate synthase
MALSMYKGLKSNTSTEESVFIIAEAGVNHNGDLGLARKLVDVAKDSGADCVKFQTFKAENIVTATAPKAPYQLEVTDGNESQLQMLKKLELSFTAHKELIKYCREKEIGFLSTPYSVEDIELLEELDVDSFKIASGQLIEPAFLRAVAGTGKLIYLSTGMASLGEVAAAVNTIRSVGNERIILLQCTTNYPSDIRDANLLAIPVMAAAFGTVMGYSDHTRTNTACLVAIGLGARVIEKHITLDRNLPGPDHKASATPEEFKQLCTDIREAVLSLGSGRKEPCKAEVVNARGMRRSLVASRQIRAGEVIQLDMITFKRPGTGIRPDLLQEVVGCAASTDIEIDEIITWAMCGERQ